MLKARRLVVYQDSSVSWKDTVQELLDRGEKLGLQLWGANFMHNIPVTTLKGTFDYFGDQPCAYLNYTSLQAGFGVYKQTPFVVRAILEPWAKCALERDCLIPGVTSQSISCSSPKKEIHMCHRFDQSVLSMITSKVFASDRYKFHIPEAENGKYMIIDRDQRNTKYFDEIIPK
ncbi:hypothetical protein Btru_039471 [Bulinus truncatus]|nr:hypothetical protein Btru_039471 [Bulinus truncatus]